VSNETILIGRCVALSELVKHGLLIEQCVARLEVEISKILDIRRLFGRPSILTVLLFLALPAIHFAILTRRNARMRRRLQERRFAPALASLYTSIHVVAISAHFHIHDSGQFLRLCNSLVLVPDTSAPSLSFAAGIRLTGLLFACNSIFDNDLDSNYAGRLFLWRSGL
jgi:hypothetical protein